TLKNGGGSSGNRVPSGAMGPDFTDVVTYGRVTDDRGRPSADKLVAIKRTRDGRDLVVLKPDLSVRGTTALPFNVKRLRVAEKMAFDLDGNGTVDSNEILDLAVVAGDGGIAIVLLGRQGSQIGSSVEVLPRVYGQIPIRGSVNDIEIDGDSH